MSDNETVNFYRTRLPHWEVKRGIYFVTMHVKGSLPKKAIDELERIAQEAVGLDSDTRARKHRDAFRIMEKALHEESRIDYLVRPEVSRVCIDAIQYRHSTGVWKIIEFVLMPNHIHLFFQLTSGTLGSVMRGFKRWTSQHTRQLLGLKRPLWQQDWFDHWSRSPMEDERIVDYIRENPVKAGLVRHYTDWPHGSWNLALLNAGRIQPLEK